MEEPGFWDNAEEAAKVNKQIKPLEAKKNAYESLKGAIEDAETLILMAEEEDDDSLEEEIAESVKDVTKKAE